MLQSSSICLSIYLCYSSQQVKLTVRKSERLLDRCVLREVVALPGGLGALVFGISAIDMHGLITV